MEKPTNIVIVPSPGFLPSINTNDDLPKGTPLAAHLQLAVTRSLPFIRDALKSLSLTSNLVALYADLF